MHRLWALVIVLAISIAGCGKNEVTVEVRGGDGNKVRLDANDLQFKFNRLVDAGTFSFKGIKRGTYGVGVVAGTYLEAEELQLEAAPIWGVKEYSVVFDVPAGANTPFKREGTIVYASRPPNARAWDLFAIRADGSERWQLTDTRGESERHPAWSPDGRKILFTRGDVMSNIDIYVMDEGGGNVQRLTEHPERDARASWSPDGNSIAFVSQREGAVEIWLMDADGGNKRKLVKGRKPTWTADGRKIVFTSSAFDDNDELYIIDRDGANMQRLTDDKRIDQFPSLSPVGDGLVFCSERFGGQELMVAKADGEGQTRVTIAEKTYEVEPVWSPDGKGLAYSGGTWREGGRLQGTSDIFLVGVAGFDLDEVESPVVEPINLTNDDREDKSPSWRSF